MNVPQNSHNSYKKAQKEAKEFYKSIGAVWCPILNESIIFNSIGFFHLTRKGGEQRSRSQQLKRFSLLPYAAEIIADPSIETTQRTREE